MTAQWLTRFTTDLKEWIDDSPSRKPALCNIVGTKFSNAGPNPAYRDHQLAEFLTVKTDYITSASLYNVIQAGKQVSGGLIDTHIALYYLAKVDPTYSAYIDDIEKELFGDGRTFFDIFHWCPSKELASSLRETTPVHTEAPISVATMPRSYTDLPVTRELAVAEPTAPQLRLNEPGFHNHPSHFSQRAIKEIIGRQKEAALLRKFVEAGPGFRWLQLAGVGGQGKSRMAYELMEFVGSAWERGFLHNDDLDEFQGRKGEYRPDTWRTWQPQKPHLIIIDYVIGREAQIGYAMDKMADRQHHNEFHVPVCILLVERQRWDRGGLKLDLSQEGDEQISVMSIGEGTADWFNKLNRRSSKERSHNDIASDKLRFGTGVIELKNLDPDELVKIVRSFSNHKLSYTDNFIKEHIYRIDRAGRPLFAYFLSQALANGKFRPDWEKPALLQYIFTEHCRKRWDDSSDSDQPWGRCPKLSDDHFAIRLALLATMIRFVDCRRLVAEMNWPSITSAERYQALALTDGPLDGGPEGLSNIIPALEPDILGEWFVLRGLEQNPKLYDLLESGCYLNPRGISDFIIRAAQDFPGDRSVTEILKYKPSNSIAKAGFAMASYIVGSAYFIGTHVQVDLKRATEWFEIAARAGNIEAMSALARCYKKGYGVEQNASIAFEWYQKSAIAGDALSMMSVSLAFLDGNGTTQSDVKFLEWLNRAAMMGQAEAMFTLGTHYFTGYTVSKNYDIGLEWLYKAAEIGQTDAMLYIGNCYLTGTGVNYDVRIAVEWCRKAADTGEPKAMFLLGECYREGLGVEKDLKVAKHWFDRANLTGYNPPNYYLN